jgi:hypothetical protein
MARVFHSLLDDFLTNNGQLYFSRWEGFQSSPCENGGSSLFHLRTFVDRHVFLKHQFDLRLFAVEPDPGFAFIVKKMFRNAQAFRRGLLLLKQSIVRFLSQMGPTYEPNSFGGPQADPKYADPAVPINVSGPGQRYENHFGKDDFMEVRLPEKLCERLPGGSDVVDVDHRYSVCYSAKYVQDLVKLRCHSKAYTVGYAVWKYATKKTKYLR